MTRRPASSTNPFRKSLFDPSSATAPNPSAPPAAESRLAASIFDSSEQPRPHPILHTSESPFAGASTGRTKPVKKVRVQSPPASPQQQASDAVLGGGDGAWPVKAQMLDQGPPALAADLEAGDTTDRPPPERLDEFWQGGVAAPPPSTQKPQKPQTSSGRLPPNPFNRTLHDIEPRGWREDKDAAGAGPQETTKAVDFGAFSRLLMTGIATPRGTERRRTGSVSESSSTTETSSTTSSPAGSPPKPVTSITTTPTPTPAPVPKPKPPPPPPSRHSRHPRAESRDLGKSTSAVPDNSPSSKKSLGDLDRPLPPPPPVPRKGSNTSREPERPTPGAPIPAHSSTTPAAVAPPAKPPLPRKDFRSEAPRPAPSLLPAASAENNAACSTVGSTTAERRTSMESIRSRAESIRSTLAQAPPPALPPPRRHGKGRSVSLAPDSVALQPIPPPTPSTAPSTAPSDTERSPALIPPTVLSPTVLSPPAAPAGPWPLFQQPSMESVRSAASFATSPTPITTTAFPQSSPLPPPPPPARNPSTRASRPPSRPSGNGTARESVPPPPPPSRQRGGSRSSVDTGNGTGKKAGADSAWQGPAPGGVLGAEGGNGTNILADLAALQREVDAYMNKS